MKLQVIKHKLGMTIYLNDCRIAGLEPEGSIEFEKWYVDHREIQAIIDARRSCWNMGIDE